jgi:hypothetical protein
MREDIVQYCVHVTFVLFPQSEHTFVIVTCNQAKRTDLHSFMKADICVLFVCFLLSIIHLINSEKKHLKNSLALSSNPSTTKKNFLRWLGVGLKLEYLPSKHEALRSNSAPSQNS